MKTGRFITALAAMLFCGNIAMAASPQVAVTGHRNPNISIIDMDSKEIVWQLPMGEGEQCNSLHFINNGKEIAFSTQTGARIVNITSKKVVWEYEVEDKQKNEVHSITPRKDGGVSIFVSGTPARVIEFSAKRKKIAELKFDGIKESKHGQFRQAIMGKNGNYLIPTFGNKSIIEMTRKGKIVKTYSVGVGAFAVREGKDGNWLLGAADAHCAIKYSPEKGAEVGKITDLKDAALLYVGQVEEIDATHTMIANWSGHNKAKKNKPAITGRAPQLIVIDDNNNITWAWDDTQSVKLGMVSAFAYSDKAIVTK